MQTDTHADRRPARWLALGGVLLFALILFSWTGFDRKLERDEGIFAYASVTVADGHPPYVEAFDNTGPLGPIIGGLGAWIGRGLGVNDLTAIRFAYLVVSMVTIAALFFAAQRLFRSDFYAVVSVLSLLTLGTFTRHAAGGPRPKLLVILFIVVALWALSERWWVVAGAASALSALAWQTGVLIFVVVVIMAVAEPHGRRLSAVGRAALGLAIPMLATSIYFAVVGAFSDLWESAVVFNLAYFDRFPVSLHDRYILPLKGVWGGHQFAWPILVGGLSVLVVRLASGIARKRWSAIATDEFAPWSMAALVFGLWTFYDYQGVIDLYPLLPLGAVGAALGIRYVSEWADWGKGRVFRAAIVVPLMVVAVAASIRVHNNDLDLQHAEVAAVVAEDDRLVAIGSPQSLLVLDRRNPNRYTFVFPSMVAFMDDYDDGGFDGYVASLMAFAPDVVATDGTFEDREELQPLYDWLESEYERVERDWFTFWTR